MKKKMNKAIIAVTAIAVVIMMCSSVFAAGSITKDQAVSKALKDAGLSKNQVTMLKAETEKKKYEVEFIKEKNKAEYDYSISKKSGRILEKSIDYIYKHNSSKKKIGKKAAMKKVAKYTKTKLKIVKKGICTYEYEDNEGTYTVKFKKGNYFYYCELLAPTGKIIEFEKEYVK